MGLLLGIGSELRVVRMRVVVRHGALVGGRVSVHLVVVVPLRSLGEAVHAAVARVVLERGVRVALHGGRVRIGAGLVALLAGVTRVHDVTTGPGGGLGVGGVRSFEGFYFREFERRLCSGVSVWLDIQAGGTR